MGNLRNHYASQFKKIAYTLSEIEQIIAYCEMLNLGKTKEFRDALAYTETMRRMTYITYRQLGEFVVDKVGREEADKNETLRRMLRWRRGNPDV